MEKYGRGWQRLPSWVGDDRQLIQPGGRPAKGGQMLGFFFTPWPRRPGSAENTEQAKAGAESAIRGGEVGWGVEVRWAEGNNATVGRKRREALYRHRSAPSHGRDG
jgi:hypothetical protein